MMPGTYLETVPEDDGELAGAASRRVHHHEHAQAPSQSSRELPGAPALPSGRGDATLSRAREEPETARAAGAGASSLHERRHPGGDLRGQSDLVARAREGPGTHASGASTPARPALPRSCNSPHAATPWPADRLVCGTLRISAKRTPRRGRKVACTIQHGTMTFYDDSGTAHADADPVALAQEQVASMIVTVHPAQTRKFSICCGVERKDSTQVWCRAKDQVNRNKWLAVLHRLGVDLYCEEDSGAVWLVREGVRARAAARATAAVSNADCS